MPKQDVCHAGPTFRGKTKADIKDFIRGLYKRSMPEMAGKDVQLLSSNALHCLLKGPEARTVIVSGRPYEYLKHTTIAEQCRCFGEEGEYNRETQVFRWHNGATTRFVCVSPKQPVLLGIGRDSWVKRLFCEGPDK